MKTAQRMPVGFVGHGAPTLALDPRKGADLRRWGAHLPRPSAILVVSAHWLDSPVRIGATEPAPLIYDFYGFPDALYRLRYPCPPAPGLADRVEALLAGRFAVAREPSRGLDHGAWVPLRHLFPDADVPVLQISMPAQLSNEQLFALGQRLTPLRDEGVWILGSGNVTHNLRRIGPDDGGPPPGWARDFDAWVAAKLSEGDVEALLDPAARTPSFALAHPTDEHYRPLLVALGAGEGEPVRFPVEGFEFRTISRRSVHFG